MPASREALAVTGRYRAQLLTMRARSAQLSGAAWLALSLDDLDASYARWQAQTVAQVEALKRAGVALTDAYLAAYVAAELGQPPRPAGISPEPYLDTEDGRSLARALAPPLLTVKAALKLGRSDALRLGAARATRIVAEEVAYAPRQALGDLMRDRPDVSGWRRATSGQACGACLAAADGRVHDHGTPFRRHSHCRCLREAVVRGVRERYQRPTGQQIFDSLDAAGRAALFHGRGGAEKAELISSGQVPLSALARRDEMAVTEDHFTEAPLADLRAMANGPGATSGHDH